MGSAEKTLDTAMRRANGLRGKADRLTGRAAKFAEKNPQKAARLERKAQALRERAENSETRAVPRAAIMEKGEEDKRELAAYRRTHPLEVQLNKAASMHLWLKASHGRTSAGPLKGAYAELFNANAHKEWTASRLVSNATIGVASGGLGMTGRKNVGQAQITIQLASGVIKTFKVKPQDLAAANRYVHAFNAYADQLVKEDGRR